MIKNSLFLVSTVFIMVMTAPAWADITRGCKSYITIGNSEFFTTIAKIEGVGRCKNKFRANECRRRARDAIRECHTALWQSRWEGVIPQACRRSRGSRRVSFSWSGILPDLKNQDSIKERIEHTVCCGSDRLKGSQRVVVEAKHFGDKGCAGRKVGPKNYQSISRISPYDLNCPVLRSRGLCGPTRAKKAPTRAD